jgi:hypothetical protein
MLPKKAYNKVIQGLKHIKAQWDEDRAENPTTAPYEIDCQLRAMIARCAREEHVHVGGNKNMEILCDQTIKYLVGKKILVGSPYWGVFFPLPEGHAPLPSKEELRKDYLQKLGDIGFFKKG